RREMIVFSSRRHPLLTWPPHPRGGGRYAEAHFRRTTCGRGHRRGDRCTRAGLSGVRLGEWEAGAGGGVQRPVRVEPGEGYFSIPGAAGGGRPGVLPDAGAASRRVGGRRWRLLSTGGLNLAGP